VTRRKNCPGLWLVAVCGLLLMHPDARASLIYLYDFPGNPGSGLASDQTNGQPSGATFSDFTRTNVGATPTGANEFGGNTWSLSGSLDSTVFESFSITADVGFHLNLDSLTFSAQRSATGPQNMEVALFLNGSTTASATYDFSPTASMVSYSFNFPPLTDSDNATTATFKFYGWNATSGVGGQLYLDDVATNGAISNAPEPSALWPILLLFGCVSITQGRRSAI
jgi:hypothetical protein